MVNAQEWLDKNYPSKERVKRIEVRGDKLEGDFVINDFLELEIIDYLPSYCSQISNLKFVNCPQLKWIWCFESELDALVIINCPTIKKISSFNNYLTSLDFLQNLNPQNLTQLFIGGNSFPSQNLAAFSKFINLEELELERNPFFGSLIYLKALNKLKELNIYDTNIDSGLEHLPDSLKNLSCDNTKLETVLKPHEGSYQAWKRDYLTKILAEENIKINSLEDEIIHLSNLIKKQKEKIVKAYLHFAPEKELLKELIIACLEYNKVKKQRKPAVELRRKFNKIHNELEYKVGEEFVEEIETILTDCEDLVQWELELESEIIKRKKLLEDAYQKVLSITININERIEAHQGNIYIANIIKGHADLDYTNYQQEPKLEEMLEKDNLSNEKIQKEELKIITKSKINNELTIIPKLEKNLIISDEETKNKITGNLVGNSNVIGNTFVGDADLSYNRTLNQQIKNIQGFNIEGNNNTFTNPSVQGNTFEAITYEEEIELQATIETPSLNNLLK